MKEPTSLSLPDFLEKDFKIPPFLIRPLIPCGGVGLIEGKRGAGKTQLVFTMAQSMINGTPFLGRYETSFGRFCYIGVDMPVQILQKDRLEPFSRTLDDPSAVHIVATTAGINILDKGVAKMHWVSDIQQFDPDFIVLDTYRKIHRMDENAPYAIIFLIEQCRELFGEKPFLALLCHEIKYHEGTRGRSEDELIPGSGAILDDTDVVIRIKKIAGDKRVITVPRQRVERDDFFRPITCRMDDKLLLHTVESAKTALDRAEEVIVRRPDISKHDLVMELEDQGVSQTRAYDAAGKVVS